MTSLLHVVLLAALFAAAGCEEEMRPPPPPADVGVRDSNIIRPPPGDGGGMDGAVDGSADAVAPDAGVDGAVDADAGDAGLPTGCFAAGGATGTTADIVSGGATFPFAVNRSFGTWDETRCLTTPTILVGLTEGSCIPSVGDQLVFALEEDSVGTTITIGTNTLLAEPDDLGLTVRFRTATGGGEEWGTCAGSSGTITFTELGTVVGSQLTATYDMTLTDCRAPLDAAPITVTGSFDLPLEVSFETICL